MTTATKTLIAAIVLVVAGLAVFALVQTKDVVVPEQYDSTENPSASTTTETNAPSFDDIKETTVTAKLGETVQILGASAVVTEVVEDSRCPAAANCIWAGTVRVKVRATYGLFAKTVTLSLGEPYSLNGHSATLTEVSPQKTLSPVDLAAYSFTFLIK